MAVTRQCTGSAPPDDELLAWNDGEATETVRAHLDGCVACRETALRYARQDAVLRARLRRIDCPDPLQLGEYALDVLPATERTQVAGHVLSCVSCTEELALFRADMRSPEREEKAPGRVWRAVPRMIARLWSPAPRSSPGVPLGVRGDAVPSLATYSAAGIQISVDVQPEGPVRWTLLGLVVSSQPSGDVTGPHAGTEHTVEVRSGETIVAQAEVDDMGNFVCPSLPAGTYELALHLPTAVVVIPRLEVGPL